MNRHLKKYSKDKMFSKIIYFIIEEMKYYKSKYYDLFAELNECEPVLTRENIDRYYCENKEELENLYKEDEIIVYDFWDACEALDYFFNICKIPENSAFEDKWIRQHSKFIIESIFKKIEDNYITKNELLENIEKYIEEDLEEYVYLSGRVHDCIIKSKEYMIEKVKYIFELNYLINYDEQKQLEIIDNSINYIHTLFEKKSNLNLEIIKELELAFSLSDLEKRIIEEEQILLNEESKYYSQMIEFRKFINIFYYDVVNEDNCLKIFIDFYCNIIMFTATVITLRKIKNNKTERVIKDINSYLSNKQTKYEYFFIELKKRLNLYNKNITLSIVELIYKQLMNEQLDSDTELNKMHHRFNINKKTLSISKNQISNEMTFNEKLASFHNILIKK